MLNADDLYSTTEFLSYTDQMNKNYGHPQYFSNPTFQLCVQSRVYKDTMIHLQFLSKLNNLKLNFQIFDKDDLYLSKPILFDQYYHLQCCEKRNVPLETNHNYLIVCSCSREEITLNEFKLIGYYVEDKNSNDILESNKKILLQRIDRTFGELPYRREFSFHFPLPSTIDHNFKHGQIEYHISNVQSETKNNALFIRIVPLDGCIDERNVDLSLKISVKIYDSRTCDVLHSEDGYYYRGIIINDFKFTINDSLVLSIEMEDLPKKHVFPMKIYLGSKKDILVKSLRNK